MTSIDTPHLAVTDRVVEGPPEPGRSLIVFAAAVPLLIFASVATAVLPPEMAPPWWVIGSLLLVPMVVGTLSALSGIGARRSRVPSR